MNPLQIWFISFIFLIVVLFVLFYKAVRTRERKYIYLIVLVSTLMGVLAFIPM